jgi:ATP-dependent RNA helicase DDX59
MWVEDSRKKNKLFEILQNPQYYHPPLIVFVDSKVGAEMLADAIEKVVGIEARSIHGDKSQQERSTILSAFKQSDFPVLVATGVLGRGIDLLNVTQVINFGTSSLLED